MEVFSFRVFADPRDYRIVLKHPRANADFRISRRVLRWLVASIIALIFLTPTQVRSDSWLGIAGTADIEKAHRN